MGFLDNLPPKPSRSAGPQIAPTPGAHTAYAAAALRDEVEKVASAPEGQRNATLNTAAFSLGQLVASGAISELTVIDELQRAAEAAGLHDSEIRATIRSGLSSGEREPREIPERQAPSLSSVAVRAGESHSGSPWGNSPPIDGADWMFSPDVGVTELWGQGDDILWADGEALLVCGAPGVGKSTLAGQLLRGQLGLQPTVLDLPVTPVDKPILMLAMDRPAQIRRSLKRQFDEDERDLIAGRLLIRPGPPITDMAIDPTLLTRMAEAAGAGVVYVDSLKDAVVGLSTDEAGAMYNRARQSLLATGINICELHHLRKPSAEAAGGISSVYGSTWLTSGAGSVVILSGEPGDLVVRMRQVKMPANEVGPWHLHLDPDNGSFTVQRCNLTISARKAGVDGLTAEGAAMDLYETNRPTAAEKKKAERQLTKLENLGKLTRTEGVHGPVWFLVSEEL